MGLPGPLYRRWRNHVTPTGKCSNATLPLKLPVAAYDNSIDLFETYTWWGYRVGEGVFNMAGFSPAREGLVGMRSLADSLRVCRHLFVEPIRQPSAPPARTTRRAA